MSFLRDGFLTSLPHFFRVLRDPKVWGKVSDLTRFSQYPLESVLYEIFPTYLVQGSEKGRTDVGVPPQEPPCLIVKTGIFPKNAFLGFEPYRICAASS